MKRPGGPSYRALAVACQPPGLGRVNYLELLSNAPDAIKYSRSWRRCSFDGGQQMTAQTRYDKSGRLVPDTGHGCGCRMCKESGAARYERRSYAARAGGRWSALRRNLVRMIRSLVAPGRAQAA